VSECRGHLKILGTMVQSEVMWTIWLQDLCTQDVEDHNMNLHWALSFTFTAFNKIKFFWMYIKSVNLSLYSLKLHLCYYYFLSIIVVHVWLSSEYVVSFIKIKFDSVWQLLWMLLGNLRQLFGWFLFTNLHNVHIYIHTYIHTYMHMYIYSMDP